MTSHPTHQRDTFAVVDTLVDAVTDAVNVMERATERQVIAEMWRRQEGDGIRLVDAHVQAVGALPRHDARHNLITS